MMLTQHTTRASGILVGFKGAILLIKYWFFKTLNTVSAASTDVHSFVLFLYKIYILTHRKQQNTSYTRFPHS